MVIFMATTFQQCELHECQMSELSEERWPEKVLTLLGEHGLQLNEIKTRLDREVPIKLDLIMSKQDITNGRVRVAEGDISENKIWRGSWESEHRQLKTEMVEAKSDIRAIGTRVTSLEGTRDRATGGFDGIWKLVLGLSLLCNIGQVVLKVLGR